MQEQETKKQAPNYLAKSQVWSLHNNHDLFLENTWKQTLDKSKIIEQQEYTFFCPVHSNVQLSDQILLELAPIGINR